MTFDDVEKLLNDNDLFARVVSQNKSTREEALLISEAFSLVFKKNVQQTCGNCLGDALAQLRYLYKKDKEQMAKQISCKHLLRAGVVIRMKFGCTDFYTNENLTDDVAEKYILEGEPQTKKGFEGRMSDFQKIPAKTRKMAEDKLKAIQEEMEKAAMEAMQPMVGGDVEVNDDQPEEGQDDGVNEVENKNE